MVFGRSWQLLDARFGACIDEQRQDVGANERSNPDAMLAKVFESSRAHAARPQRVRRRAQRWKLVAGSGVPIERRVLTVLPRSCVHRRISYGCRYEVNGVNRLRLDISPSIVILAGKRAEKGVYGEQTRVDESLFAFEV